MEDEIYGQRQLQIRQKYKYVEENRIIENNWNTLRHKLPKKEKNLLLQLMDKYDLIICKLANDCYANGFFAALQIVSANLYRDID